MKISTLNFDWDYKRQADGQLRLVSEKAVIRVRGKLSKVPIGEDEEYKTYEEAAEAMRQKWVEYFRERRANRSEAERLKEAKRQKQYRERRKQEAMKFKHETI